MFYSTEKSNRIKTSTEIADFKLRNPDWESKIESVYGNKIFILKHGTLENYTGTDKGLDKIIDFCDNQLGPFLSGSTPPSDDIKRIVEEITN